MCLCRTLQFLDHDITLTHTNSADPMPITVPAGDDSFTPGSTIPVSRSAVAAGTGTTTPRQHPNAISSFVDGSQVYGADSTRATALRTRSGGRLATSAGNLPPFNTAGLPNANDAHVLPNSRLFLAGGKKQPPNPNPPPPTHTHSSHPCPPGRSQISAWVYASLGCGSCALG